MARYYRLPFGDVLALEKATPFPPLNHALKEPNGLLAIGGDLSPERLLSAYQQGIFPWFSQDEPICWYSPDPRMVLFPAELKVSQSLKKTLKSTPLTVRYNSAFREVMQACAITKRAGQGGTWITAEMIEAYCALHEQGYAISAETWRDNVLVGGCYGIRIGKMFYGESMFHHVKDASKIAFVNLVRQLHGESVGLIDCQMKTDHLASLGAREISRTTFAQILAKLLSDKT